MYPPLWTSLLVAMHDDMENASIGIDMLTELAKQVRMPLKFREHQDCVQFYSSFLERVENEISSVHVDSLTYFAFSHQYTDYDEIAYIVMS